jgi:hypothetical protein
MSNIIEYNNILPELLCNDIIDLFIEETEDENKTIFNIPKNNDEWKKIEKILYKELLIKIKTFKNHLLMNNTNENNNLLILLNKQLFTKHFTILKYDMKEGVEFIKNYQRTNNRFNVMTYVFFLNSIENGGEIYFSNGNIVKSETGKLLLFPDDMEYEYKCKSPISNDQYIISGQLCYDNILS